MRSQSSAPSKLLSLLMGKRPTDCPSGASIWILGIRWNAECGKGFGSKNLSQKIPPHTASPYVLQWPVRVFYSSLCFQSLWSDNKGAAGKHFRKGCGKISSAQHTWNMTRVIPIACWKCGKGFSQMNCKISEMLSAPLIRLEIKTIKTSYLKTLWVVQNPMIHFQSDMRHRTYCMVWICINALCSSLIDWGWDCC